MSLLGPSMEALQGVRAVHKYGRVTDIVGILAEGKGIAPRI